MGGTRERKSNIEVLRILAMLGVIVLHYNHSDIGGGFAHAQGGRLLLLYATESLCIAAVNLYVLISGYFLCTSNERNLLKPLMMVVQVVLFGALRYGFHVLMGTLPFHPKLLLEYMLPINYFVILYIALYWISPFLNMMLQKARENGVENRLVGIGLLVFSVYPTLMDMLQEAAGRTFPGISSIGMHGSQSGYTIVNFALMYLIGAWLKEKELTDRHRKWAAGAIVGGTVLLTAWCAVGKYLLKSSLAAWHYCNPLVILLAVSLFVFFAGKDWQSRWVNRLAKGSFSVFLLHTVCLDYIHIPWAVTQSVPVLLGHQLVSAVGIYLLCWAVGAVYAAAEVRLWGVLSKRIPGLTREWIRSKETEGVDHGSL